MDVERSDNVLAPLPKRSEYYMVTVNPYKAGEELWEDISYFRQDEILKDILAEVMDVSKWVYIDHQIEEANRGKHIHIVMGLAPSPCGSLTPAQLSKRIHKKYGKPRLNRTICCDVRTSREVGGFLWYIRKTRPLLHL